MFRFVMRYSFKIYLFSVTNINIDIQIPSVPLNPQSYPLTRHLVHISIHVLLSLVRKILALAPLVNAPLNLLLNPRKFLWHVNLFVGIHFDGKRTCIDWPGGRTLSGKDVTDKKWTGGLWQVSNAIVMAEFVLLRYVIKDDVGLIKDDAQVGSRACGTPKLSQLSFPMYFTPHYECICYSCNSKLL